MVPSVLDSSVSWSLQCLISALTQMGQWWTLFKAPLFSRAVGREGRCKQHWRVLAVPQPHLPVPAHGARTLPVHTAQALGCSTGNLPRPALGCMHLPGLSHSGSGTRVVLRGADSVGPVFRALLQAAQVMRCLASTAAATYRLPRPCRSVFWVYNRHTFSGGC